MGDVPVVDVRGAVTRLLGGVALATVAAGCLLVSSFDRYDADAPELVGDGAPVQVPGDAEGLGPFKVYVEAPSVIDGAEAGKVVVRVERTTPTAVRVRLTLPEGARVTPPGDVELAPTVTSFTFEVDVSLAPRGKIDGTARATSPNGEATHESAFSLRVTGPGELDTSFGAGGSIIVPESFELAEDVVHSLVVDGAGNIVMSGAGDPLGLNGDRTWKLVRTSASSLDPTFGDKGVLLDPQGTNGSVAHATIVKGEGLWTSGAVRYFGGGDNYDVVLRRYSSAGVLTGSTTIATAYGLAPSALLAAAADGAWVAALHSFPEETLVAKVDVDGAMVGPLRRNVIPLPASTRLGVYGSAIAPWTGALEVVGDRLLHAIGVRGAPQSPMRVAAYLTSGPGAGALDTTFGSGGAAVATGLVDGEADAPTPLAARPDASLVVVGARAVGSGSAATFNDDGVRMLARAFSKDGAHLPAFPNALGDCAGVLQAAVSDAAGRVIAVGYFGGGATFAPRRLVVARLNADGTYDRTFGSPWTPGKGCSQIPGFSGPAFGGLATSQAQRVAIDSAGRLVVAGHGTRTSADAATEGVWWVARFRN